MSEETKTKPKVEVVEEDEVFAIQEKRDEAQIMEEIKDRMMKEFIYQFEIAGRPVTGLSWTGVKECARHMGHM